jgi:hypothetical protein
VHVAVHEAALACGKLTRVLNRRSAYPSEVIMSRGLVPVKRYATKLAAWINKLLAYVVQRMGWVDLMHS